MQIIKLIPQLFLFLIRARHRIFIVPHLLFGKVHLLLEDCQQPSLCVFPDVFGFSFSRVILSLKYFHVVLFCVAGERLSHKVETIVFGDAIPLLVREAFVDSTSLFEGEACGVSITILDNIGEEGVISFFLRFLESRRLWLVSFATFTVKLWIWYFSLPVWLF